MSDLFRASGEPWLVWSQPCALPKAGCDDPSALSCEGCVGHGRRLDKSMAERICEGCGHLLSAHGESLNCYQCGSDCGIDCGVIVGGQVVPSPRPHGAVELVMLALDELEEIERLATAVANHADAIGHADVDTEDMKERTEQDCRAIEAAVHEARRVLAGFDPQAVAE